MTRKGNVSNQLAQLAFLPVPILREDLCCTRRAEHGTPRIPFCCGGVSDEVCHESCDCHAGQSVPRGADGVLPGHQRQVVAVVDGCDLPVGELECEDRSPLVLAVELEERPVSDVATSG